MTNKELILALATKAGIDTTDPYFMNDSNDVPEAIERGINTSLLSLQAAKNNHADIKGVYQSQVLDRIDKDILAYLDEAGIEEEVKQAILQERSTFKKVPLLAQKIAELKDKKAAASNVNKPDIQAQIDGLQQQLRQAKEAEAANKANYDKELKAFKINAKLESLLASQKTIHDELDPSVKNTILSAVLHKHLQDKQAKFELDENGNIALVKNDGMAFYSDDHQAISPNKFIETVLAKEKQFKVSQPTGPVAATPPAPSGNNQQPSFVARNQQALKDYQASLVQ